MLLATSDGGVVSLVDSSLQACKSGAVVVIMDLCNCDYMDI